MRPFAVRKISRPLVFRPLISTVSRGQQSRNMRSSETAFERRNDLVDGKNEIPDSLRRKAMRGDTFTDEAKVDLILSASVHLIAIDISGGPISVAGDEDSYDGGVMGEFCALDWALHKADPSSVPMFRDLVGKSQDCSNGSFRMDLKEVAKLARAHDNEAMRAAGGRVEDAATRAMEPTGFVFHESRCGSTLAANTLAAMSPDSSRVYSESPPPLKAMIACGEAGEKCAGSIGSAAALLKDAVYMMGRTNDPEERHLFFKVQSIGTRFIKVFRRAFPDTPWIFVYRDPVQVMMSHLDMPHMERANCVRPRASPPNSVRDLVRSEGMKVSSLTHEEYCAAHLATICNSALAELESSETGHAVNYNDIIDDLTTRVIPHHFKVPLNDQEIGRIMAISSKYSKGRGKGKQWEEDSERKDERATDAIKKACEEFLEYPYEQLENQESQEY
mmetsp:Transcript_56818/g.169646  ORF Transcript_56818/g.169646 Transcript_56818/m.169646 type:complete len:446 (-) Transcript_56818:42-1379(-)